MTRMIWMDHRPPFCDTCGDDVNMYSAYFEGALVTVGSWCGNCDTPRADAKAHLAARMPTLTKDGLDAIVVIVPETLEQFNQLHDTYKAIRGPRRTWPAPRV